jgi:hypothetical protein
MQVMKDREMCRATLENECDCIGFDCNEGTSLYYKKRWVKIMNGRTRKSVTLNQRNAFATGDRGIT